jgi:Flp pilus assembly protein TadB
MLIILNLFTCSFSIGAFLILSDYFKVPRLKTSRAILSINKREKKKSKNIEVIILDLANKLSRFIRIDDYKKRKLKATLKSADIKLSPETYIAKAWIKAGLVLLSIIPALFIFPLISPVILFLSIAVYFKEIKSATESLKVSREEIEWELPRFVSMITQELKASRDVLSMLETYKKSAGPRLKKELDITIADMKSGSYEAALTRFESRVGSSSLSEVIRGLIGVLRGDNGVMYFQMLSHDLKQKEFQRLKTLAQKRPGKIRKYSFMLLACFILMYLVVMGMEILKTLDQMF